MSKSLSVKSTLILKSGSSVQEVPKGVINNDYFAKANRRDNIVITYVQNMTMWKL